MLLRLCRKNKVRKVSESTDDIFPNSFVGFDSSVSAVIASPLAQRQCEKVSKATSPVIALPLTQEQGEKMSTSNK